MFVNHLFGKRGFFCRYHLPNQRVTKVPVPFEPVPFSSPVTLEDWVCDKFRAADFARTMAAEQRVDIKSG
jgi:hypothetical protein